MPELPEHGAAGIGSVELLRHAEATTTARRPGPLVWRSGEACRGPAIQAGVRRGDKRASGQSGPYRELARDHVDVADVDLAEALARADRDAIAPGARRRIVEKRHRCRREAHLCEVCSEVIHLQRAASFPGDTVVAASLKVEVHAQEPVAPCAYCGFRAIVNTKIGAS